MALLCILSVLCAASAYALPYRSADPEPGTIVSSLREVTLTMDCDVVDFGSEYQNVTVTGENYSALCTLKFGKEDNQIVVSFSEITENGEYTINFPAKALVMDMTSSPAFTLTYTVGEDLDGTSTLIPAPGDVKWLYDFVYSNSAIDKNLSAMNGVKATVTTPLGDVEPLNAVYDWQIGEGKYRFTLSKLAVAEGEYTINIPGDLLYYNNDNYERVYVPACTFKYNVVGGQITPIEGTPSLDAPTTLFNQFTIAFPGYETIEKGPATTIYIWMEGRENAITSFNTDYNLTVEGNAISYQNIYSSYTDPGTYYMTFPEGSILLGADKEPCTPSLYEFSVVEPEPVKMTFTPADGANVNMLYHATVCFPEIESVSLSNNPNASLLCVREDGTTYTVGAAYGANGFKKINDNTYDLVFSNMATTTGEYLIVLQKNSFNFEGGFNQEATITVNFTAPETVDLSIDPADGSSLDKIQQFTISFPNESVVTVNPYLSNKNVVLYTGSELIDNGWGGYTNQQVGSTSVFTPVEGSTNAFTCSLNAAAINKDDYLLVIPTGLFLIGEDCHTYSSPAMLHYSCTGEGLDKIAVNPYQAVKALSEIEITFINETEIFLQNDWVGFSLYKEVEGQAWGTYLEYPSAANGGVSVEGNVLKVKFENTYTEDGNYYIDITQYSLFMSDHTTASTPQRVTVTVDSTVGIEGVNVDASATDSRIFTITGIQVKDMSKPGLYIVGGKKVLVK